MTEEMTEPAAGGDALPGPGMPSVPHAPGRRERELLRVEIRRQEAAAKLDAQRARFEMAQAQRQARADQRREDRADKRAARGEAAQAVSGWIAEHQEDLLIVPLIGVPGWLGWDAMSEFGSEFWSGPGRTLPVISECGMWLFSFAIARARKRNPNAVVWPKYLGMFFFAGLCAALNAAHGLLGPLPGVIPPGSGPAVVYAAVSVSGLFAHQIMALSERVKVAKRKPPKAKVATATSRWWHKKVATPVAIPAGAGGNAASRPGGQPGTGQRNAAGNSGSGPNGINGSQSPGGSPVPPVNGENLARGDKGKLMRDFWDTEIKDGRIPSAADMNEAAGNKRSASLGSKNRREWIQEPVARKISGDSRDDPAGEGARS